MKENPKTKKAILYFDKVFVIFQMKVYKKRNFQWESWQFDQRAFHTT